MPEPSACYMYFPNSNLSYELTKASTGVWSYDGSLSSGATGKMILFAFYDGVEPGTYSLKSSFSTITGPGVSFIPNGSIRLTNEVGIGGEWSSKVGSFSGSLGGEDFNLTSPPYYLYDSDFTFDWQQSGRTFKVNQSIVDLSIDSSSFSFGIGFEQFQYIANSVSGRLYIEFQPEFDKLYSAVKDIQADTSNIVDRLGQLLDILSSGNLINLIVPSKSQLQQSLQLFNSTLTSSLGIFALPFNVLYSFLSAVAPASIMGQALSWNSRTIQVPAWNIAINGKTFKVWDTLQYSPYTNIKQPLTNWGIYSSDIYNIAVPAVIAFCSIYIIIKIYRMLISEFGSQELIEEVAEDVGS